MSRPVMLICSMNPHAVTNPGMSVLSGTDPFQTGELAL